MRIGITTGEALVALDARPETGEGMASGDVVNTAARLQAAAPENGDPRRRDDVPRDASARSSTRTAEPVEAKGKAEPVAVWKALEARARFGVDVERAAARRSSAASASSTLARATRSRACARAREPQLVTLVGVPGIGKSRLVARALPGVERTSPELIYWRQGRSLPYGEGVTSGRSARW